MAKFVLSAFADEAGDSLEEQIRALRENEIGYIEPRNIGGRGILDLSAEELRGVRAALDGAGIRVGSLGSPIGKAPIDGDFTEYLKVFDRALDAAQILGTPLIRMFSFFVPQEELALRREEVLRRLRVMVERAAARGITLCHENESRIYGQMPREVEDLLTNVKGLGGIFDPANYRMNGADIEEGIRATLVNFRYMHVKDAIYETQTITPAGEGEGQVAHALDTFNAHTDARVYLTVEPHLHSFTAYRGIDEHELRGKYSFRNNRESFDFAVNALKKLLTENGYRKDENNQWIK